jgi:hypothetical protein
MLKNGTSIGTATGTSFAVTGLSASTSYSLTVEATDANGTSGPSSSANVTTLATSCTTKPSADGIGCDWDHQLRHEPELDGGHCSRELHDQQLHHIAERNLNRNRNRHIVCRGRPFSLDRLQFHRRSDGRCRYVERKFSHEYDDARWRRIGMRDCMERHCGLYPRHDGKRGRRKLRREFLDAEPESLDQQRRSRQRRTLDCG